MAKKNQKTPGELQVDDKFYMLNRVKIDEHKGSIAKSSLYLYDYREFIVDGTRRNPKNPDQRIITSIVKDEELLFIAPKDGYNNRYNLSSLIVDEDKAKETALVLNAVERKKALVDLEEIKKQIKAIEDIMAIFDPEKKFLDENIITDDYALLSDTIEAED